MWQRLIIIAELRLVYRRTPQNRHRSPPPERHWDHTRRSHHAINHVEARRRCTAWTASKSKVNRPVRLLLGAKSPELRSGCRTPSITMPAAAAIWLWLGFHDIKRNVNQLQSENSTLLWRDEITCGIYGGRPFQT